MIRPIREQGGNGFIDLWQLKAMRIQGWVLLSDCVDGEDRVVSKNAAQKVHVSSPASLFAVPVA